MSNEFKDLKDAEKGNESAAISSNWIRAGVLIVVGLGLLASNFTDFTFNNWWALFMLIPAFGMFASVWRDSQVNGRITSNSTGPLISGLAMVVMMIVFLFNLNWSGLWPLGLVFGGIAVLLSSRS